MTAKEWFTEGRKIKKELDGLISVEKKACVRKGEISQKNRKLKEKQALMMKIIDKVSDTRCRWVLVARYINCMDWEEVAKEMSYEVRQVYRIHEKALEEAQKYLGESKG